MNSRNFWALAASKNYIVRGADASNTFAEADLPKILLYGWVDKPFWEWYQMQFNAVIPEKHVLPVHRALQGHPESPSSSWD